jgi:hypothetical protein
MPSKPGGRGAGLVLSQCQTACASTQSIESKGHALCVTFFKRKNSFQIKRVTSKGTCLLLTLTSPPPDKA